MGGAAPHVRSPRPALEQAYGVVTFGAGCLGLTPPGDRAAARISLFARRFAYGYPRTLAVCSSTPLEPPWLCRPEALGCVWVPYSHPPIAGRG